MQADYSTVMPFLVKALLDNRLEYQRRADEIGEAAQAAVVEEARVAKPRSGFWVLQDAKARFSELVRKVRSEGPQHVTVHGRDEVVVVAAEEFRRLQGRPTGQALIAAMQASPYREIDLEPTRVAMPVRDVSL